jgi:asparagine synthase (glutamine-hydrolysing)
MCGIAGFTSRNEDVIKKMTASLSWRGSDAIGYYLSDGISLGHTRLSIIDLDARANQPMDSDCGRYHITYNGEIYNFEALKFKYLTNDSFKTTSETEVILKLFALMGEKCFSLLSGMFALAIWDANDCKLYLARDRSGIKPLFYSIHKSILYFSSDPSAISQSISNNTISMNALACFMRFGYSFGNDTFYDGVSYFPADKYAVYSKGNLNFYNYSHYEPQNSNLSLLQINSLEIERQLVADCNVGVFLSGGIDSSIIAYHASRSLDNLNTYTAAFSGSKINPKFNQDAKNAIKLSKVLGTNHHEVITDTSELIELFKASTKSMTLPISNPTALPLHKLSEYAGRISKVVLGGDGNDELFWGYDRYRILQKRQFFLNNFITKYIIELRHHNNSFDNIFDAFYRFHSNKDGILKLYTKGNWIDNTYPAETINKFYTPASNKACLSNLVKMDRMLWLQNFSLLLSDNITMQNNLELRVPFLSDEIINYALSSPISDKLNSVSGKIEHRNAYRNILPKFIFMPKKGFMPPASDWIRDDKFKSWLIQLLLKPNDIFDSLFDKKNILKIYEDHVYKRKYYLNVLWPIFVLKYWLDNHKFNDISLV